MNHRFQTYTLVACLLASTALGRAQDPSASTTPSRVGVINIQQAIASTGEGKKALAQIQKKYEPKRKELEKMQQDINALQDQLQKQSATLSDDERARLQRDVDEKQRLFKRKQEDDQADFQADNQEAVQRIGQKMVRVISDYAEQNGFTLVLDSQLQIYYAAKGTDITDPIIKLYDARNPLTDAAEQSSSAKPPSAPKPAAKPKP